MKLSDQIVVNIIDKIPDILHKKVLVQAMRKRSRDEKAYRKISTASHVYEMAVLEDVNALLDSLLLDIELLQTLKEKGEMTYVEEARLLG
ncbi:hypothetical protein MF069_36480 [Paenibacillus mucilaginosus]|uniref:hypothetical protein n=1 Tax=Paenibacillus mucilaginosus TaxID=61624 RepID=UPI001EF04FB7|nr:hypothetical protein [Paenibacillus mucilaginosus]MCG7218198.1 hypothetical protein [Paenibacillus mucilaginosus]